MNFRQLRITVGQARSQGSAAGESRMLAERARRWPGQPGAKIFARGPRRADHGRKTQNKPNRRGRRPRLGIADCRLGIRQRETQAGRRRCAPNKPNHSICGGFSSAGHYISKAAVTVEDKADQPGSVGPGKSAIRSPEPETNAKPQCSKRPRPGVWTECETKPICRGLNRLQVTFEHRVMRDLAQNVPCKTNPICPGSRASGAEGPGSVGCALAARHGGLSRGLGCGRRADSCERLLHFADRRGTKMDSANCAVSLCGQSLVGCPSI
jgi:hypothetical protein